ncbi:lyase family protein, partial [Paratractidigestivibacter faecalis]|uniref:lyase family protein n=1 Tax=Paratractidigestivibacter faecalis TaxID=2292441 RepID=UPI0022B7DC70
MALWGGRFEKGVDAFTQEFGASLEVDKAMAQQDIAGSRAHAKMLAEQGIISEADQQAIDAGLADISGQIANGDFAWDVNDEDIHMAVEGALTRNIGTPGRALHTGRSRNDQVAT